MHMKEQINKWIISAEVFLIVLLGMCIVGMLMRNDDMEAALNSELNAQNEVAIETVADEAGTGITE